MESIKGIEGVIFDYGGTIDSRGVHWSEVIWNGYKAANVEIDKDDFRDSYVFAERQLAKVKHILPEHNFYDLLLIKMRVELNNLADKRSIAPEIIEEKAEIIAKYCYDAARECVEEARPVLEALSKRFPMVLVSNFYGNVESVLTDFDVRKYFGTIVESAVVGVRKPNPQIFQLGVDALNMPAEKVVVVGDSYDKDIVPAETIGCKTIWIKAKGWTDKENNIKHPNIIKSLSEIEIA